MSRRQVFLRVVRRALRSRPGRLASSAAALAAGATLASTFLALYLEIPRQLTSEFRSLGPNLVMVPRGDEQNMSEDLLQRVSAQQPSTAVLPWLYSVGQVHGEDVVLSGTLLGDVARVHPSWQGLPPVTRSSGAPQLLAGEKTASHFGWKIGDAVTFSYSGKEAMLPLSGIVSTGGSEDSHLLVPLRFLQDLTSRTGRISTVELAVPGSAEQVTSAWNALQAVLPEAEIRPLRAVVESEARVMVKVRGLMLGLAGIVLLVVMLGVFNTVNGLVLDRQKDIGVMKALGASDGSVMAFFFAEMLALAMLSAVIGYAAGLGLAGWVAARVFHSSIGLRGDVFLAVVGLTALLAVAGAALPVRRTRSLQPAVILRGD